MVKTQNYADPRYVGDPVNVINLFNQFEVDEICLLDISATVQDRGPRLDLVKQLADECWVPLSYGGGVSSLESARSILALGIEKVVIGTAAAENPDVVTHVAREFGSQAVVASVDALRLPDGTYEVRVRNGTRRVPGDPAAFARELEGLGAGEILLNAIHRDGTMEGFDATLIQVVASSVSIPLIAAGGAGSRADLVVPIREGASAVAAGSLFVYQGRSRAVLVNFPPRAQIESMFAWRGQDPRQ
jgi:cyclase